MTQIHRVPVAAGRFYPAEADALSKAVQTAFARAERVAPPSLAKPRTIIAPHAGYAYSADIAALAHTETAGHSYRRVVILSPSHKHAFDGMAVPSQDGYDMPGFSVALHKGARKELIGAGLVTELDAAHEAEHGIETQLPFLHHLHPKARLVPVVIGDCPVPRVAELVDHLADEATLFVLSSDLSHFHDLKTGGLRDLETASRIERGDLAAMRASDACGIRAIAGYLASKSGRGARALRLGLYNSSHHSGDIDRVVGYGAWRFSDPAEPVLSDAHRHDLLRAARHVLHLACHGRPSATLDMSSFSPRLHTVAASFVTLQRDGRLRGCIGSMAAHRPLVQDVVDNALRAGFRDERFQPITAKELPHLDIKISVLSRPAELSFSSDASARRAFDKGAHGLILTDGKHRGVLLPQVWDQIGTKTDFLKALKRKAGLPEDYWSASLRLFAFTSESFDDADRPRTRVMRAEAATA
ncbi:AmmeMemoRadiSam system protein B [Primorskyibacter aestuariivivens]|uniref:AmmeMemoRadiSam system protein B n=1 Tax=Primorskyibacter aestuariivivens TaxID=1888912 RepID=UPI002300852E|nr:AmmeMemoRadiSam system protein B [Primorskyibacter aestuariivivens]MDA7430182.1 AmmeMemoRadiSam system protein B [Primorskyibacter aestuariivivens]